MACTRLSNKMSFLKRFLPAEALVPLRHENILVRTSFSIIFFRVSMLFTRFFAKYLLLKRYHLRYHAMNNAIKGTRLRYNANNIAIKGKQLSLNAIIIEFKSSE